LKKIACFLLIILYLTLMGCGPGDASPDDTAQPDATDAGAGVTEPGQTPADTDDANVPDPAVPEAYFFKAGNLEVRMGWSAVPVVDALGEPLNYFEAPSCAFEGLDKIFYYSGFELFTYPVDGEDFISSVNLTDDSVTTAEGVYLGMKYEKMVDAYGEGFIQNFGQYMYELGDSTLSFLIENGVITVITYNYTDVPDQQ